LEEPTDRRKTPEGIKMKKLPNPRKEKYRTAHKQNSDGSYHCTVMPADLKLKNRKKPNPNV